MKKIRKTVLFSTVLLSAALVGTGCDQGNKNKDKDNAMLLALGYLSVQNSKNNQMAVGAVGGVAAASSVVGTALASNGVSGQSYSYYLPAGSKMEHLFAAASQDYIKKQLNQNAAHAIATASTLSISGGTCVFTSGSPSTSTCTNAVISGTGDCMSGGTVTMDNVTLSMSGTTNLAAGTITMNSTMNGGMTFNKCVVDTINFLDYPNKVYGSLDGSVTYSGTNSGNVTLGASSNTSHITDKSTLSSSGLSFNGDSAAAMEIATDMAIDRTYSISNATTSLSGSILSMVADVSDTLTGTYTVAGTVGGAGINSTRTYNNENFHYHMDCTMDTSAMTGSCTITPL